MDFPPDYMVGSKVYSYHLVKELIRQNIKTFVFTRLKMSLMRSIKFMIKNLKT